MDPNQSYQLPDVRVYAPRGTCLNRYCPAWFGVAFLGKLITLMGVKREYHSDLEVQTWGYDGESVEPPSGGGWRSYWSIQLKCQQVILLFIKTVSLPFLVKMQPSLCKGLFWYKNMKDCKIFLPHFSFHLPVKSNHEVVIVVISCVVI